MKTFSELESKAFLEKLENWIYKDNAIESNFRFKNFTQSLAFIVQVGILAEKANHHPEIFNIYDRVQLRLTTHDADGVTEKDFDLAEKIDLQCSVGSIRT